MARIRTIKPDFWRDESLSEVSAEAALLAIGLLNIADDEGYFKANPKLIEADIFPLRELSSTTTGMITELVNIGYIEIFEGSDGKKYGLIPNFVKHQVISKAKPSEIKGLRQVKDDSSTSPAPIPSGKERKGKEGEGEREKEGKAGEPAPNKKFTPPTQIEIAAFAKENKLNLTGFENYYTSNGWKVGRGNPMKDWKAAARGWSERQGQFTRPSQATNTNQQAAQEAINAIRAEGM
jgi:hypothetical protein